MNLDKKRRFTSFRVDGSPQRTASGALRLTGHFTRTGIVSYHEDGKEIREYRPEEHVFSSASLSSLKGVALTDLHPPELVKPNNWKQYAVGHVTDAVRKDGNFIAGEMVIHDEDMIRKIENRSRIELSCGYLAQVEDTPGEFEGERYDAVQTEIVYNHVALLPEGTARAGREAKLRLDSNGDELLDKETIMPKKKKDVERNDAEDVMDPPMVEAVPESPDNPSEELSEMGEVKAMLSEILELLKKEPEAESPESSDMEVVEDSKEEERNDSFQKELEARVSETVKVREAAKKVCGETVRLDGRTNREICEDVLNKAEVSFDENTSDETILGMVLGVGSVKQTKYDSAISLAEKVDTKSSFDRLWELRNNKGDK